MDIIVVLMRGFSVPSFIGMSLTLAKPRFSRPVTAVIWLLYAAIYLLLPPEATALNYAESVLFNAALFFVCTRGKVAEKGFLFISYGCIYVIFCTFVAFLRTQDLELSFRLVLVLLLMALLQFLLYAIILPKFKKASPYIDRGWGKCYAIVISFFVLLSVQAVYLDGVIRTDTGRFQIFLLTAAAFFITYAALFASLRDMAELAKERRKQIHTQLLLMQVEAQANEVELASRARHDTRHHNSTLLAFARSGDMQSIIDYLEKQTEQIDGHAPLRFCENETINNVLCVYHAKAKKAGIRFHAAASATSNMAISPPDLVAVLANITENALHGALQSGAQAPSIRVDIHHKAGKLVIVCENSCDSALDYTPDMPEELHGIGIRSVRATAETYGGTSRFSAKDGLFRCIVAIPLE